MSAKIYLMSDNPIQVSVLTGQSNPVEGNDLLEASSKSEDGLVSFQAELPLPLQLAMTSFIERYPNWDQYRLMQAAIAGFLVQNGVESRAITRLYVGNMFGCQSLLHGT